MGFGRNKTPQARKGDSANARDVLAVDVLDPYKRISGLCNDAHNQLSSRLNACRKTLADAIDDFCDNKKNIEQSKRILLKKNLEELVTGFENKVIQSKNPDPRTLKTIAEFKRKLGMDGQSLQDGFNPSAEVKTASELSLDQIVCNFEEAIQLLEDIKRQAEIAIAQAENEGDESQVQLLQETLKQIERHIAPPHP